MRDAARDVIGEGFHVGQATTSQPVCDLNSIWFLARNKSYVDEAKFLRNIFDGPWSV